MIQYRYFKDSFWGRVLYHISQHKIVSYKEEHSDYIVPERYYGNEKIVDEESIKSKERGEVLTPDDNDNSNENNENENNESSASSTSGTVAEGVEKADDGKIIVTWDGEDDPENPYNWPLSQKIFFSVLVGFLTVSVYMGSAIYTPGIQEIIEEFNTTQTIATLPLSLFVVGYGTGTNLFSPLSEYYKVGRTSIYIITLFIFFILQIPTALAKSIAALCVLRFIGGLFASVALATGGASLGDVISLPYVPIGIASWSFAAVCGPSLGPLIGSALVNAYNWRATFWFMCALSGGCFLFMGFFLPESYGKTILYRKAQRLRAITGNQNIVSEGEIENQHLSPKEIAMDILWRPLEVMIYEPVVLLINIYIALVYSIMYLWFEAFPEIFINVYHFTLVEMGVTYLAIIIGIGVGASIYIPVMYKRFTVPMIEVPFSVPPEVFIPMAIFGSIMMPVGLLIFAWTANAETHWIACLIGALVFAVGAFCIFQTLFNYLSFSFFRYLASVFASNNLVRSNVAAFFPIIGQYLFGNLATKRYPVAWGTMILFFISAGMISIPVLFYLNGPKLRARSKYAN